MLAGAALFVAYEFLLRRRRARTLARTLAVCALFVYLGAVFALTVEVVRPAPGCLSAENLRRMVGYIDWSPVNTIAYTWRSAQEARSYSYFFYLVGGNFVLLMPLGVLLKALRPSTAWWQAALILLGTTVGIEALQLVSNVLAAVPLRYVEMSDVFLNFTGGFAAYLVFSALRQEFLHRRAARKNG